MANSEREAVPSMPLVVPHCQPLEMLSQLDGVPDEHLQNFAGGGGAPCGHSAASWLCVLFPDPAGMFRRLLEARDWCLERSMALKTPFPRKKIKCKGAWARRPFSTSGWSLSPFQYHLLPARLPVPFPQSCCSCKATGEGFPQARVTLAVGSQ